MVFITWKQVCPQKIAPSKNLPLHSTIMHNHGEDGCSVDLQLHIQIMTKWHKSNRYFTLTIDCSTPPPPSKFSLVLLMNKIRLSWVPRPSCTCEVDNWEFKLSLPQQFFVQVPSCYRSAFPVALRQGLTFFKNIPIRGEPITFSTFKLCLTNKRGQAKLASSACSLWKNNV